MPGKGIAASEWISARADRLLTILQMERAAAAWRMRRRIRSGDIVGRCRSAAARNARGRRVARRDIVQDRRQPPFHLLNRAALARGVVLDLIALDLADAEVIALR